MESRSNKDKGSAGEALAAHYLEDLGFRILERNFRFGRGEIDLVAEDGRELVFVEVKWRRTRSYGRPEDAISPWKERQLQMVAEGYLFRHGIENRPCRFDVIAIDESGDQPEIRHLRNAF